MLAVVVPMLNEERGILPTLEALAAQRDADFDVVFVDNGSADATVAVVERFASQRGLLRWRVIHETQKGTGAAAGTGVRAAIAAGADAIGLNLVPGTRRALSEKEASALAAEARSIAPAGTVQLIGIVADQDPADVAALAARDLAVARMAVQLRARATVADAAFAAVDVRPTHVR